jgi:sulfhydrogenase subunit beta (sulfur reductase)
VVIVKKMIAAEKLPALWEKLSEQGELYLPVTEGPVVLFKQWTAEAEIALDATTSAVSPKDIFFPREETYLSYKCSGQAMEISAAEEERAITAFGLHPCDLKAIEMLDRVYLDQDPVDELYKKRREKTTVVALACNEPDPFCFCGVFGINPGYAPGADIMAFRNPQDGDLILETLTQKGELFFSAMADLLSDLNGKTFSYVPVKTTDFNLDIEGLSEKFKDRFNDPAWDQLYKSCLGCGVCTYVCPTCYCFDVEDYGHDTAGLRFRCWDSCMYGHFTQMAGGHNPRPSRKERVRQRFLHKLQYYPQKYGELACVGCGRCLRSCPVNLDIVQVIKALGGEKVEQR